MKNIDDVVKNKKCTGCSACFNICPTDAITMIKNKEGFLNPQIDLKKCIHCGLCNYVCPSLNEVSRESQYSLPKVYAGWNKDEKVRLQSSSGGIFSIFAEYFLNKKGYVCGADFDENNKLRHIIISNKRDLKKLRGSKYVQSEVGDVYKRIKELLEKDNWVLFSGVPCQSAGLKNYLRKEYEKLLIVDTICHGVPSPLVFEKYLKEIEDSHKSKIEYIKFREKSKGWKDPQFVLRSQSRKDLINKTLYQDEYGRGFLTNLYLGPACTDCMYSKFPKVSDVTLGDFWGVWNHKSELDDNKGTSLIIINNKKGETYINKIKKSLAVLEEVPIEIAINNNYPVFISSDKHPNREEFFKEFSSRTKPTSNIICKYLDDEGYGVDTDKKLVGLLNFHYENHNFGANLVAYSLQTVIEKLGYKAKIINYKPFPDQSVIEKFCSLEFYKFRQDFLKMTKLCRSNEDLLKLNLQFDTFITGSDQVWRQLITGENALHYFLDFSFSSKKLLSYGASFGNNRWDGDEVTTKGAKELLKRFKAISVREKDGLEILTKIFDINKAALVLDPTLLLSKEDYDRLINYEELSSLEENYIAYYFLFDRSEKLKNSKKMEKISNYTNSKIINIAGENKLILGKRKFVYNSIPRFLNAIKGSKFVITDSYHGVLFSILYNKDFICIGKNSKALSRFDNIFSLLEIDVEGRFLSSIDELKYDIFLKKIDYKEINKNLNKERKRSFTFLKDNLKKNKENNSQIISELEKQMIDEKLNSSIFTSTIEDLYLKITDLEKKILEENLNQSNLQEQLSKMENSISWRMTKPFRKMRRLIELLREQGIVITIRNIFLKVKEKIFKRGE